MAKKATCDSHSSMWDVVLRSVWEGSRQGVDGGWDTQDVPALHCPPLAHAQLVVVGGAAGADSPAPRWVRRRRMGQVDFRGTVLRY